MIGDTPKKYDIIYEQSLTQTKLILLSAAQKLVLKELTTYFMFGEQIRYFSNIVLFDFDSDTD